MGMVTIFFNGAGLFKEIVNTLDKKPHVKSGENCSSAFRGEEVQKQDGRYGGHLGFPIRTV